ncbi:MAG TPA: transglycosylase domain-containing protein, partial [Thermoanaerobaculia bacterium]|nr:transglycosylase domain-containing protein [Thermoanaerobaculia bacterium]
MHRLSRARRYAFIAFGTALLIVVESFLIYVSILNRRVSRELAHHTWREPTILVSAPREREIVRVYGVDWRVTPPLQLGELPRHVGDAFIAAEDVRFRHHIGIDPIGIARALLTNVRARGIQQGGSTIDQQIIKQRFLSNERTWRRKFVELILAVILDLRLSKNDVLEIYLNEVYLGHHEGRPILGVDEASRLYFAKPARALRVDEAALLASIVRAPNRDNPIKRPDLVHARRDAILAVMHERRWIDDAQYRNAVARTVAVREGVLPAMPFPFYVQALRAEVVKRVGLRRVLEGGLTITCEMDPDAQRAAERVARRAPSQLEARYRWIREQSRQEPLQVALLSVDPRNGGVRALVGGTDFNLSAFDRTSAMRRQPGSAFKTFAYFA